MAVIPENWYINEDDNKVKTITIEEILFGLIPIQ